MTKSDPSRNTSGGLNPTFPPFHITGVQQLPVCRKRCTRSPKEHSSSASILNRVPQCPPFQIFCGSCISCVTYCTKPGRASWKSRAGKKQGGEFRNTQFLTQPSSAIGSLSNPSDSTTAKLTFRGYYNYKASSMRKKSVRCAISHLEPLHGTILGKCKQGHFANASHSCARE